MRSRPNTEQCGGGMKEGHVFAGLLGLHSSELKGRWQSITQTIGIQIIDHCCEQIIKENACIEMEISPLDESTDWKKVSF
jgi:hypothetical protein